MSLITSSKIVGSSIAILMTTIICLNQYQYCEGKRLCYICNTTIDGTDCLDFPENITIPENPSPCRHFCTIIRKEFLNIPGKFIVISLERNCEERPFMLDGIGGEDHVMTYYRSCRANLCNDGDGLTSLKYIPEEPDEPEEELPVESSSSSYLHHHYNKYTSTTIQIFKIYFFAYVAYMSSIT